MFKNNDGPYLIYPEKYNLPKKKWLEKYQEKLDIFMSFNKDNTILKKTINELIS